MTSTLKTLSNLPDLIRRIVIVLLSVFIISSPTTAYATPTITTAACKSTATAPSSTSIISFDAFVPNTGCWIKETFKSIKSFGIFKLVGQLGTIAVMLFFFINLFNSWIQKSIGGAMRAVLTAVVATVLINDAILGGSITNKFYSLPMIAWSKVYTSSNNTIKKFMSDPSNPSSVANQTKQMAETILDFTNYAFMGVNSMGTYDVGTLYDTAADPDAMKKAAAAETTTALQEAQTRAADDRKLINNMTWIFQLGYLLLLTFFMAFAGMMYLSAMSVVLGMFAMPLAIAFWAGGSSRPFQTIMTTWAVAICTAGIAPVMMAIATQLALNEPTKYMQAQIAPLAANAKTQLTEYQTVAEGCVKATQQEVALNTPVGEVKTKPMDSGFVADACTGLKGLLPFAKALGSSIFQIIIGFLIMIVTMSVTMAVGVQLLRSIPGLLGQMFGGIGLAANTPTLMQAAGAMASSSAMLTGSRMGGGGGGGGGGGASRGLPAPGQAAGGAIRGAAGGAAGVAVGAAGLAGRAIGAGSRAMANSAVGQSVANSSAGQAISGAANRAMNSQTGQAAMQGMKTTAANVSEAYKSAQQSGGALTDRGMASMAGAAIKGGGSTAASTGRAAGQDLGRGIDRASGTSGQLGLQSGGAAGAARNAAADMKATAAQARANQASGNTGPDAQGRTGADKAYHQLASQGNLPSQKANDAQNARQMAAQFNAQERSMAGQNPNYQPQTMSQGQAAAQLKAEGKDSASQYQATQTAQVTGAQNRQDSASMKQAEARVWSQEGNINRRKADLAASYQPSGRAENAGNPTGR